MVHFFGLEGGGGLGGWRGGPGTRVKKTSRGLSWLVECCCFTSTETVGLLETGAQDGHLDFHTAPELGLSLVDLSVLVP